MKKLNAAGYLTAKFDAVFKNDNWVFNCPFCNDEKSKFGVSLSKGVCHCFKCGYAKRFIDFVAEHENVNISGVFAILSKYKAMSPVRSSIGQIKDQSCGTLKLQGYQTGLALKKSRSRLSMMFFKYLHKRHMTDDDIAYWHLGLCNDSRYIGRIIIPFYVKGKFVYFVARKFIGSGSDKYKNPPKAECGIGKAQLLFNIDNAQTFNEITICEGVFDVFNVGRNAVAIMGKQISNYQVQQILQMKCKTVNIMLDANTKLDAFDVAHRFENYKQVNIYTLKKGDPASAKSPWEEATKRSFRLRHMIKSRIDHKSHF